MPRFSTVSAKAFHPLGSSSVTRWVNSDLEDAYFADHDPGEGQAGASIQLPQGAVVTRLTCEITDKDTTHNLECALLRHEITGQFELARVTSSGSGGMSSYHDTSINLATIQNNAFGYSVVVENALNWKTAGSDLRIHRVFVEYTLNQVP